MNPSPLDHRTMRLAQLTSVDPQLRAALPLAPVNASKVALDLGMAEIAALVMHAYADRPALAARASETQVDPSTGRRARRLATHFDSITYRELWLRARKLANAWYHNETRGLRANELLCVLGFAGIDFVTVDLAAIHNGAVVVPLQTNAPIPQLLEMFDEVAPRWVATSLKCLPLAIELVTTGHRPCGLLVFDVDLEVDDEREWVESARVKLDAAGMPDLIDTLQELCARGGALSPAPLFSTRPSHGRMCTIYYTSGSTGLPKGAMYPESMVKAAWLAVSPIPIIYMHYMPMNHAFGRSGVFASLGSGGTCYFTAQADLSTLFDDIRMARPTFMAIVPRICEMVYQRYQMAFQRRAPGAADREALKHELIQEIRDEVLGGRLLNCNFGSAPLAPELREFMEACLGFAMDDHYGATEISGVVRNQLVMRPPVIDYKLDDVPELGYFRTDKPHPRGELRIRTQNVMLGYYKRPDATVQMFDADGYYKTGDIMAEIGSDRLAYVDRRNNVLKLSQGEFVAISRLEALYTNGHPLIRQAYLYGSSERSYLLGVFVPNEDRLRESNIDRDDWAVKAALREAVKDVARAEALNAYEVPRDFIVEREAFSVENGLLAGIGKYQRPGFKLRYAARLERLYDQIAATRSSELQLLRSDCVNRPVLETVGRAVQATLGLDAIDLSQRCTFAELGGDSLAALSCALLLEEIYGIEVPASVINNPAGSLHLLSNFIERARDGAMSRPTFSSVHGRGATIIHAKDLTLEKFIDVQTLGRAARGMPRTTAVRTVLVTGANGYLGRFLCLEWLQRMSAIGGRVVCITRGEDSVTAARRISAAFDSGDPELKRHFETLAAGHLEVLAGDLSEPELGLNPADWRRLAEAIDLIVHPAACVNHVLPYPQLFGANVVGTAELIRLAVTDRVKCFDYISTVAAATIPGGGRLDEVADVRKATPTRGLDGGRYADGYAHSKWAGEVLLREAHERCGLPVTVFRSDMILAHSRYVGQVNVPDMFTRWLFSVIVTGLAPRSFYAGGAAEAHYDGLPVDFTAQAMAGLSANGAGRFRSYHVVNPHDDGISMDTFIDWAIEAGYAIRRIDDYADWFSRFETALRALPDRQRLLSSWPLLQQMQQPMPGVAGASVSAVRFQSEVRAKRLGVDEDIPHLSAGLIGKYLNDLRHLKLI